jgi:hypothetical protein
VTAALGIVMVLFLSVVVLVVRLLGGRIGINTSAQR